ncbi:H-NS histone family protein [Paraburkholderia tagetis]|uniref:H-NS histone family protein n=1 Tax=Paraburkholderia tagetis TaxID=2913261 RepID=UPI002368E2CC|nr:H-NS family nucleoid-associated regulatory protein [Paraburkholderia tagetis]
MYCRFAVIIVYAMMALPKWAKPNFAMQTKFKQLLGGEFLTGRVSMVTLDAIKQKIAKLEKQAEVIAEKQSSIGLAKIRDLMHKHGLEVADIERFVGKRRGRKPGVKAANGAAKALHPNAHPVAPKYADPKTGATWTGRGRAPAWIRDVKDRSKFLIAAGSAPKAASAKTTGAKKTAVKRAAVKKAGAKTAAVKKTTAGRGATSAVGTRGRKKAAPAKKAAAPRKMGARKARAVAAPAAAAPAAAAV